MLKNERLLQRNSYPVGSPTPTQLTFGKTAETRANGAKSPKHQRWKDKPALNAMLKSNENINGVTLNDFLGSLGAKDRATAEANIIKSLMDK